MSHSTDQLRKNTLNLILQPNIIFLQASKELRDQQMKNISVLWLFHSLIVDFCYLEEI